MKHYALCLQIPADWERLDGDATAVRARVERRFSAYALTPSVEFTLIAAELAAIERAREAGTVVWAAQTRGAGTVDDPLSTVSLVVATHPGPISGTSDPDGEKSDPNDLSHTTKRALDLTLPGAKGMMREERTAQRPAGACEDIRFYQAQAVIVPDHHEMVVSVTASTPDPGREEEARTVVETIAWTLRLVPVESTESS